MATRNQQRYAAALADVVKRFDRMEKQTVRAMLDHIRDFRKEVIALLAGLPADDTFNQFRLTSLRDSIDGLIAQLNSQLTAVAKSGIQQGAEFGLLSVIEPLTAAGVTTFYNRPALAQINTMVDFSADLIKGITDETRKRINTEINRMALGGITPFQAQKNITDILGVTARGPGKLVVRGIGYNAERIARTEVNRAYNVSGFAQMQEVGKVTPAAQKRWNATGDFRTRDNHINAHGQLVDIDKPFYVGGENMMYPLDPAGSGKNTINCRCRMTVVHPDIGVVGGPLDGRIERERERREEMA